MSMRLIHNIDEESPKAVSNYLDVFPMDVNYIYAHPSGVLYTPLDKAREVMANYPTRPSPMAQKILQILQNRGAMTYQDLIAQRVQGQTDERRRLKAIRPSPEEMATLPRALQQMFANTPRTPANRGYFSAGLAAPHTELRNAIQRGNLEGVRGWLGVHAELLRTEPQWWNHILAFAQERTNIPEEPVSANTAARIVREIRSRIPRPVEAEVAAAAPVRSAPRPSRLPPHGGSRKRRGLTRKSRKL